VHQLVIKGFSKGSSHFSVGYLIFRCNQVTIPVGVRPLVETLTDYDSDFTNLLLLYEFLQMMTKETWYKSNQQYRITQDCNVCNDHSYCTST